jgi:hypothetical protein
VVISNVGGPEGATTTGSAGACFFPQLAAVNNIQMTNGSVKR